MLCPDTDLEATVRRAERLRHAIMKSSVGGISTLSVTSSFGVSAAKLGDTVQTVLERADNCLYRAKETGRNKTCWETEVVDEEALKAAASQDQQPKFAEKDGTFEFRETVEVSTSLELTAMKLQAFIREYKAEVLKQEHGVMRIRIGSLGFTRRWGSTTSRQPVNVQISFGTSRSVGVSDGKAKTVHQVSVIVTPHGKVAEADIFVARCGILMREMRAYLLGS